MDVDKKQVKAAKGFFRLLFFWFLFWGPLIGVFVLDYWTSLELMEDGHILQILPFAYILGSFPALTAAFINGLILTELKNDKPETTVLLSISVGAASGFITSIIFFFLLLGFSYNFLEKNIFAFISVFVIPGAICGIINKESWRALST